MLLAFEMHLKWRLIYAPNITHLPPLSLLYNLPSTFPCKLQLLQLRHVLFTFQVLLECIIIHAPNIAKFTLLSLAPYLSYLSTILPAKFQFSYCSPMLVTSYVWFLSYSTWAGHLADLAKKGICRIFKWMTNVNWVPLLMWQALFAESWCKPFKSW